MNECPTTTILARRRPGEFVGRAMQMGRLLRLAGGSEENKGLAVLAAPAAGTSELLRQVHDRLFVEQDSTIPFYFELKPSDRTAQAAALRFLCEFLLGTVAFRRREPSIIAASPAIAEIADMAAPADGHWITPLLHAYRSDGEVSGERAFIRNCLGAPIRAAAAGAKVFVMIDASHVAPELDGGHAFLEDLIELYSRSSLPFVLAGLRRFLFSRTELETVALDQFSFADTAVFIDSTASHLGISVNEQTRDLIAVQLGGDLHNIANLLAASAAAGRDLLSFEQVEKLYTDEIFGGRSAKRLNGLFDRIVPAPEEQAGLLRLLSEAAAGPVAVESAEFNRAEVINALNYHEIVSIASGRIELEPSNHVVSDYISARVRLELENVPRALAVGEALTANIKRAPSLMARHYRRSASIGLKEMMSAFGGHEISPMLIDYKTFKSELKGLDDDAINRALEEDKERITLPRIVYAAHSADLYPPIAEICDAERSAVAFGFTGAGEKNEIVWIAAEIDSKLEATADTAAFWCDRLEMIALNCNFNSYRLWLIAPEGFDDAAMQVLDERTAFGSSRRQALLMKQVLMPSEPATASKSNVIEYEFTVPMGDDTEMIAAHAVEEIAKRHQFPVKAINQIKTAMVEACINAAEHSLSPDRKIYQKFAIDGDKLTITVANRGLRLADKAPAGSEPENGRRGWGLKLMKGLMDEVSIEQTDDGTRIVMVKYLRH